jgi:1-acyl-sn-glycerol-3-phosphate acyltransferase
MRSFFYQLQKRIRQRKIFFSFFFVLLFVLLAYWGFKTHLTEDASAILPQSENSAEINHILQNIELNERIYFNIYFADSSRNNQDQLLLFARELKDSLSLFSAEEVREIQIGVQQESVQEVSNYVLNNLPFLLTDSDYQYFDELLSGDRLEISFQKKYKTLMSPASAFTKQLIINDPAGLSLKALERLRNFQLGNEINVQKGYLFSENSKHLLGAVTLNIASSQTASLSGFLSRIEELINHLEQKFNYEITAEYFGAPLVAAGNAQQIKQDIILTVSMAVIMVVLLIAVFYRSKRLYLIIFLPAVLAVITSLAIIYLIQGEISAIALGLGSVLVGISIDYVLHIFTHHQEEGSLKKVLGDVAEPILISAATTASAFFGLWIVSAPALRDMGLFAGISILFSALFSLIFIPLFLKEGQKNNPRHEHFLRRKIRNFTSFPFHEKAGLILAVALLTPVFYYFSNSVQFQGDMNAINYMSERTKQAEAHLNEISQISQRNVFVVAKSNDLQEALDQSEALEQQLKTADDWGVLNHTQISNLLPSESLQKERLKKWNNYWTEERQQLLLGKTEAIEKQYGFRSGSFSSFEQWLQSGFTSITAADISMIRKAFLKELVQGDEEQALVITQIKTTTADKKKLNEQLSSWLPKGLYLIDKEFLTTQFVDQLKIDFQKLVNLSLLLVFLIIWAAFGRIELAFITYLPLALSWVWTTGMMRLLGLEFNIVNIIISTFIFGLGIDYCIFITRGLMQEYKYGGSRLSSFKTSILFSALTSVAGIGVLIFAQHPALKSMAFVTIIGLSSVMLLSFTLQPLFFNWLIYIRKGQRRLVPITAWNFIGSLFAIFVFALGSLINTIMGFFLITLTAGKSKRTRLWFHYLLKGSTWLMTYVMVNVKKKVTGHDKGKFETPSIIISNHQSHIDIMLMLMLHPKIILLTNDWVQRNFFYGKIVKMADFYPVLDHLHQHVELLRKKAEEGYSIMIFPEGTRSADGRIGRFHKGAFYLAEELKLDVLPIIMHGPGDCVTKGEPFLKSGRLDIHIGERIPLADQSFGVGYVERSKKFRKWYQEQYEQMQKKIRNADYLRKSVDMHYIYKGPVLEWYTKIKMNFEKNYQFFHDQIPEDASIVDLGCGNAMMDFMLMKLSPRRRIYGVDYDEDKIAVAQNVSIRQQMGEERIQFEAADLNEWNYRQADVYVLADVLHYMPFEEQKRVMEQSVAHLNPGGKIIIRDADTDLADKHKGTRLSEWQSTKVFGFNKTKNDSKQLYFGSAHERKELLEQLGLQVELIDQTKMNSNVILVGKKA